MKQTLIQTTLAHWLHQQWQRRGLFAWLLSPFACIATGYVLAKRLWFERGLGHTYRAPVPVVIVGNLYVGGTGKTPVVIALVKQLKALGWHPGLISRGYGAKLGPSARTGQGELNASIMGDEPALLAEQTGAWIGVHPNRQLACQALLKADPAIDIIVSDDGLQHLALARDVEIVVQDTRGVGNGWLLPAGPLREPAKRLKTVDVVIHRQTGPRAPSRPDTRTPFGDQRPLETAMWLQILYIQSLDKKIKLSVNEFIKNKGNKHTTAIAGISKPDRFFKSLSESGIIYQKTLGLPDHHAFEASLFAQQTTDLILITAKDAVKCSAVQDARIWVVVAEAVFSEDTWLEHISTRLRQMRQASAD